MINSSAQELRESEQRLMSDWIQWKALAKVDQLGEFSVLYIAKSGYTGKSIGDSLKYARLVVVEVEKTSERFVTVTYTSLTKHRCTRSTDDFLTRSKIVPVSELDRVKQVLDDVKAYTVLVSKAIEVIDRSRFNGFERVRNLEPSDLLEILRILGDGASIDEQRPKG